MVHVERLTNNEEEVAHVAQLVEHVLGKDEVTRSIRVVGSSVDLEESCCVDPSRGASSCARNRLSGQLSHSS